MSRSPTITASLPRRRLGAWLAALAILLQALVPAWHHAALAMAAKTGGDGTSVVICTLYGYQVVPLASLVALDETGKVKPPEHKQPPVPRDCALCQAMAHQNLMGPPPDLGLPPIPMAVALSPWIAVGGTILPATPRLAAQPRAPPTLSA
jgi:hypothetical protein